MSRPSPKRPNPRSDKLAGSGTRAVFTPSRNTVGGSLTVLPPLPQARNVNIALPLFRSAAVGVKLRSTRFQSVFPCDGVFIRVESASMLLAVPVTVQGLDVQSTPIPPAP